MKKSLVMFLVATLLLAGCTELMSDDGETIVEVNEDVALEKILDIVNPTEDSSWGMTYIMEMDMGSFMGSMTDMESEDDSEETETSYSVAMTQAMSPDGVHLSQIIKMKSEDTQGQEIEIIQKWTQTGNMIYLDVGYSLPTDSDMSLQEREMYEEMMGTQEYKMQSALSHTEAMAIMNEPMNDDDFNPQQMLMSLCMIETLGTFTPLPDEDGLTMYKVTMENDDSVTGQQVLKMWDSNNDQSLSWDEFNQDMCGEQPFEDEEAAAFEVFFNDADVNNDAGLTLDELDAFIADVDEHSSDDDFEDEDNDCDGCGDEDDMDGESMEFDFAFNSQGNVEFFRMDMEEEGNMIVYLLSDSKIESLTTSTNEGESVALPFVISSDWGDDMYGTDDGSDDEMTLDDFDVSSWDSTNDLQQIIDWFNNNYDYDEGETEMTVEDFLSDCGADENSVDNYVAECIFNNAKDMLDMSDYEDDEMWTFLIEMSECDSDTDEMVDFEELDACVSMDLTNDGYDSDSFEGLQEMFDMVDANEDGMLDSDEFATFAAMTSGEPMMVCYNMDTHEIDMSINSEADCEAAGLMWTEERSGQDDGDDEGLPSPQDLLDMTDTDQDDLMTFDEFITFMNEMDEDENSESMPQSLIDDFNDIFNANDLDESGNLDLDELEQFVIDVDDYMMSLDDGNNGHGNDDDGHDESNPGNSHDDGKVYTLSTGEAMIPFEGEFSNYWIELASCSEEYDDETDEMVNDCTPNRQIVVTSAAVEGGSSGVMFHDADNSGTISEGDMIHILDENAEQFDVRLYSVSADAYSDENPVFEMPGFTGVVGVLALLGAALLRRKA